MTTLYIAGPMTGLEDFNYPAFYVAAEQLRAAGFTVLNPAENEAPNANPSWQDWMRLALAQLIQADGVALLPGWEDSKGARVEQQLATTLTMPAKTARAWLTQASNTGHMTRLRGDAR